MGGGSKAIKHSTVHRSPPTITKNEVAPGWELLDYGPLDWSCVWTTHQTGFVISQALPPDYSQRQTNPIHERATCFQEQCRPNPKSPLMWERDTNCKFYWYEFSFYRDRGFPALVTWAVSKSEWYHAYFHSYRWSYLMEGPYLPSSLLHIHLPADRKL